jgi:hypothetical protein
VIKDDIYIAFPQVIFTDANASDEAVYAMVKAMSEGKESMVATFPPMAAFNPAQHEGRRGQNALSPRRVEVLCGKGAGIIHA